MKIKKAIQSRDDDWLPALSKDGWSMCLGLWCCLATGGREGLAIDGTEEGEGEGNGGVDGSGGDGQGGGGGTPESESNAAVTVRTDLLVSAVVQVD